jgi:metallophosphoesterase (TIGR00282 family)
MRILFIGDVVGKLGRSAVAQVLPDLRKKEKIDFTVANAENLTHGRGAKIEHLRELRKAGVDFFTSGDHIFYIDPAEPFSDPDVPVIRPANLPKGTPGEGGKIIEVGGKKVAIVNLLGWEFLGEKLAKDGRNTWLDGEVKNPFQAADDLLKAISAELIFVDFHAELTSEKRAMGFFLDGRVSAVLGTHTHVPTADAVILPKGTGYVSDIGMTGARDSVLGVEPSVIIDRLKDGTSEPFEWVEKGPAVFRAVLLEFSPSNELKRIERLDLEVS